jgi:predicted transcriptional regulator
MRFALAPIGAFFCYAYQFPIAVPFGLLLIACVTSQNRSEFVLELDADYLHVILPSFYGKTFSTINSYKRTEIKDISLGQWESHLSGEKSMYSITISNLTGMDRNRTYANLEIIDEDSLIQERAKYTFRVSTQADMNDPSGRKAMFTNFVSEARQQILNSSGHGKQISSQSAI